MGEVAILGAGSWGTALAVLLGKKGVKVNLWGRNKGQIDSISRARENIHYLPGVVLPHAVKALSQLDEALQGVKYVVLAVPSHGVRQICQDIREYLVEDTIIINTAKGLETESLLRLSQVMEEELPALKNAVSVLSGPSHAEEVGRDMPTAVVIGSRQKAVAEAVQDLFMSPKFRVYTNPDLIGVELGGALKNVIALGIGIADGLGFGDNTKAALITRGVAEIARLGVAAGANPLTFAGLTGIGDLVVTCTSMHSRNRRAGIQIGKGVPLEEVLNQMGMVVEGIKATQAACSLSKKYQIPMPICQETYEVLFNKKSPQEAVVDLMMRLKTHEVEEVAQNYEW